MIEVIRPSRWIYKTGAGTGVGVGPLAISGGEIILASKEGGQRHKYSYSGVGAGLSLPLLSRNFRLPRIYLQEHSLTGTGSTFDFFSHGGVWMTSGFKGKELSDSDFEGSTLYVEGGGGVLVAGGFSAMLCGLHPDLAMAAILHRAPMWSLIFASSRALIGTFGQSAGLTDSIGVNLMAGRIKWEGPDGVDQEPD